MRALLRSEVALANGASHGPGLAKEARLAGPRGRDSTRRSAGEGQPWVEDERSRGSTGFDRVRTRSEQQYDRYDGNPRPGSPPVRIVLSEVFAVPPSYRTYKSYRSYRSYTIRATATTSGKSPSQTLQKSGMTSFFNLDLTRWCAASSVG